MTANNEAVKRCGGLPFLYTELPRRLILGNTFLRAANTGGGSETVVFLEEGPGLLLKEPEKYFPPRPLY